MLKIFRLEPDNPLIWQLAYTDSEVDKIIANRYGSVRSDSDSGIVVCKADDGAQARREEAEGRGPQNEARWRQCLVPTARSNIHDSCICHDTMKKDDMLTFCSVGCGNNMHSECAIRWAKHRLSQSEKITCPVILVCVGEICSCAEQNGVLEYCSSSRDRKRPTKNTSRMRRTRRLHPRCHTTSSQRRCPSRRSHACSECRGRH